MKMLIPLTALKPNPYRDFNLYPIDPEQVATLRQSIHDLGFFQSVPVRPCRDGTYELAAGHHRVEAARLEGLAEVDCTVDNYDDIDIVQIMGRENSTQQGKSAAAQLDTVAAYTKLIAPTVLAYPDFPDAADTGADAAYRRKLMLTCGIASQRSLDTLRATITDGGPGRNVVYRAANGFAITDTEEKRHTGQNMGSPAIEGAIGMLKDGGTMAQILAAALTKAQVVQAKRDAEAAEAARKAEEAETARKAADAAAEAQRTAAEARAKEVEAKAKADAKAAAERARVADATHKAEAEANAAAAAAKAAEYTAARKQREAEAAERKVKADADAKAAAKAKEAADRESRESAAARKATEAKVKAATEVPVNYDIACAQVFKNIEQEKAFREGVLSVNGVKYIPKASQLPLATAIMAALAAEHKRTGKVQGSGAITFLVNEQIAKAVGTNRAAAEEEKERLRAVNAEVAVRKHWATLNRALNMTESAIKALGKAQAEWPEGKLFPVHMFDLDRMADTAQRIITLRTAFLVAA